MTLIEWRKSSERRSLAMDLLNNPTLQDMISVMESEHPAKQEFKLHDGFEATLAVGDIRGFQKAINMLRSFAEPLPSPSTNIPVTWGAEPPEEETK